MVCDRYSYLGSSTYHTQMMLKVFYGYTTGEPSSPVVAHRLRSDEACMCLWALQRPDLRTINRFRKDNADLLQGATCSDREDLCQGRGVFSGCDRDGRDEVEGQSILSED